MIHTLSVLDTLCLQHKHWHYAIRNHFKDGLDFKNAFEYYEIELHIPGLIIGIFSTTNANMVDVLMINHPEDWTRVHIDELQDYINSIIFGS